MKKLLCLTLVALATAACDAGIAGSSAPNGATGAPGGPATCPMSSADARCESGGDCGECVEPAGPACEGKGQCEEKEPCEQAPMDCKKACEEPMPECQKACEPKVGE